MSWYAVERAFKAPKPTKTTFLADGAGAGLGVRAQKAAGAAQEWEEGCADQLQAVLYQGG